YVHRIGRTARAGAEGVAVTLCDPAEVSLLRDIEKLTRLSIPAESRRANGAMPVAEHRGGGGGGDARSGKSRRRRGPGKPGGAKAGGAPVARPQAPSKNHGRRGGQRQGWAPTP